MSSLPALYTSGDPGCPEYVHYSKHSDIPIHSGTMLAMLRQKSHLVPRPPSHVYAFTSLKRFRNPGSSNCVIFGVVALRPVAEYGVPPVSFRSSWYGRAMEKSGKFVAADVAGSLYVAFDPAATAAEMEGLPVVTKLPHIAVDSVSARDSSEGRRRGMHTHESSREVGTLVRCWGPEVGGYINTVLGSDDRVLIFIPCASATAEGFREPVGRAVEGGFGVDVLFPD